MKRSWFRAVPAVLAGSLLAIAFLVPAPRASVRSTAAPSAMVYPRCDLVIQQGGSNGTFLAAPNSGLTQPLNFVGNAAACSLTIDYSYYDYGQLNFVQWDPLTLAPDPTTVALRTRAFNASEMQYNHMRADFYPPVVIRRISHLADPPSANTAMDWRVLNYSNAQTIHYEPDGAPATPVALQYSNSGPRTPLPGGHPVLSHAICGGDDRLQGLYVVQSVMTTNALSDTSGYELIQRFRVPVPVRLNWVEVAFGVNPYPQYVDPVIAILDAQGEATPPNPLPFSLIEASYAYYVTAPFWGSHYDFDHLIMLQPNHDYWLLARVEHRYLLYSRTLTGAEGPDFTANIGPYFARTSPGADWNPVPGRALSFRLIGEPIGVLGIDPTSRGPSSLRLRVTPNPAQGAALVNWSGADGAVQIEVLDARGRRVGGGSGASGSEGRWMWRGMHDDGRLLPAGVYFVRARDGAGHVAVERAVLVR